jgi:serine/threonine-protein kinase
LLVGGRYKLDRLIASGGMAQVWQATDEVLRRQVAIKLLHPHLASDEVFLARFRQEAIAAARLAHPGIVAIYDTCALGDEGAGDAIVMELVNGPTLRARLDKGALEPRQAARISAQIADALDVAHRAGLVHRDIKPANVLLCDDGRVKVADFGIAKAAEASDLTHDGLMVGTAKYLAPEQVRGDPVDPRTDIYALGVVLYEMLCGRPPFSADTDAATALARLTSDPLRPRQVRPGVPRALESVALRAMAREPADRFASAADLRAALLASDTELAPDDLTVADAPAREPAPAGPTPTFRQSERAWLVPTLLVVLVALALGTAGLLLEGGGRELLDRVRDAVRGGGSSAPVALTGSAAYDPEGTGGENDELAGAVRDGAPDTTWRTERYDDRTLPPFKSGVGIYVSIASARALDALEVDSPTPGWRAQVYVAERPGAAISDWGEPVQEVTAGPAGTTSIDLQERRGAFVLLWFTYVGDGPESRAEVAEMRVLA